MWIDFDELSFDSKVWVFQADRPFSSDEEAQMNLQLDVFIKEWATHGVQMRASYTFLHQCFVIVAADESFQTASGCSLGALTTLFEKLGQVFSLNFLDRFAMAYKYNGKVDVVSLVEFKKLISETVISENTIVFNNLIATKNDLLNKWELPLKESWQKRYL